MSRLWPLRNPLAARALEGAERWLVNRVRLTMTSAGLAERVRHVSPEARVREWRYPGSMETVAAADVDRLRAELGLAGKERVVLYAGNFAPYHGVRTRGRSGGYPVGFRGEPYESWSESRTARYRRCSHLRMSSCHRGCTATIFP
jgi:hypothetical protein